ncbi:MAG: cob(I)yrinic acid a,c-diamide adenosyltransferase, partial [Christensenellaceae bacterium]|nr:cob(I)yrinic acid a,c-diamide adenosyltransferase [Christensenellaceae bacterium]
MKDRCIHIYYGDGKGKTTAAVGQLLRSRGHGMGALLAGFLKDGSSGENRLLQEAGVTLLFAPDAAGFVFAMDAADKAAYLARQRELFLSLPARLAGLGGGICGKGKLPPGKG